MSAEQTCYSPPLPIGGLASSQAIGGSKCICGVAVMSSPIWKRRNSLALLASSLILASNTAQAQQGVSFNSAEQIQANRTGVTPLIDQLRVGLRTNQTQQIAFLQTVVQKVESGELPRGMVYTVYRWAISRNGRYPFPYFQYAITDLAKRRGVTL
jgi:sulfite exporter TauE/SafE